MQISVIMSVYNAADYLKEAVDSILMQTYPDFEFIIIDDGSTDGSLDILENYRANDSRVIIVKNDVNLGLAASLNKGVLFARGEFIARQDADDISALRRLQTQLDFALINTDIDVIGTNCYIIDLNSELVCKVSRYSKIKDYKNTLLSRRAIFPHGSVLLKREKIIEAGMYDPRFYYSQDGELWLRMLKNGARVCVLEEALYYYRTLPVLNNKKNDAQQAYNGVKRMIYEFNSSEESINQEIKSIKQKLDTKKNRVSFPNYMARYWTSLANTAYWNEQINSGIKFEYLLKAFRESNRFVDYLNYLKLITIYTIPSKSLRSLLKG